MNYFAGNHVLHKRCSALLLALVLAGCAGLPGKQSAPQLGTPHPGDFASMPGGTWPAANWWKRFGDTQLDALIERALADSPSIAVAQARIGQANALSHQVAAAGGASLTANAMVSRQLYTKNSIYPPPLAGSYQTSGDLELDFAYDFDFWGRNRHALEAALGERAAAQAEAEAAAAALSAAVAKSYYQWQALNAHITLLGQIEQQRTQLLQIEAKRVKAGVSAAENLHPLEADLAAPQQTLVQLQTQRDQALYQLKALLGSAAGVPALHAAELPQQDGGLPADVSLDLLARRPDVAAARDRVQASLSSVEVARAAFYPDFSLQAFLGLNSLQLSKLLHGSSRDAGVTPALHLPIFEAGRLRAGLEGSRADLGLAVAQYDQSVQSAVAEVNDAAVRLTGSKAELPALQQQTQARQRELDSAARRVKAGLADGRETVRDQLLLSALQDQEITRRTQALLAQIDLIKALGGGYGATPAVANR